MNAAKRTAPRATSPADAKLIALGAKIQDALADSDNLGHSLLAIRLQESLDEWHAIVDHKNVD